MRLARVRGDARKRRIMFKWSRSTHLHADPSRAVFAALSVASLYTSQSSPRRKRRVGVAPSVYTNQKRPSKAGAPSVPAIFIDQLGQHRDSVKRRIGWNLITSGEDQSRTVMPDVKPSLDRFDEFFVRAMVSEDGSRNAT